MKRALVPVLLLTLAACGGAQPEADRPPAAASPAAPAPAETIPAAPTAPAVAEPALEGLADGSFTSTAPMLTDSLGSFSGTARVTNTSDTEKTATFTYTLFAGDTQVGTAVGAANMVGAGETATVQLVSTDTFAAGVDKVEFQVDAEF